MTMRHPGAGTALTIPSAVPRNNRRMNLRPSGFFYVALVRMSVALVLGLMVGSYFATAIAGN